MTTYKSFSHDIEIKVQPTYIPEQSSPEQSYFFFSYKVSITNKRETSARLLSRHWIIVDGQRRVQEVQGEGVVGQQPLIEPGETFEYSSFCPLPTPTGNMRGSYEMIDPREGNTFKVEIPVFFLRDLQHDQ